MCDWRDKLTGDEAHRRVAAQVVSAVERLLRLDGYLLEIDASERSITHRLAIYLEQEFPEWHVDCEYNRDGHHPKAVGLPTEINIDDEKLRMEVGGGSLVLPDIIVHRRGKRKNLLVIEAKKNTNRLPEQKDIDKLEAYKADLGYRHALFLKLTCGTNKPDVDDATRWVCGATHAG